MDQVNSFSCDCNDTGFDGEVCQHNVPDCLPDLQGMPPCKNNGTCIDGIKEYKCECFSGFIGNDCSTDIGTIL
jgi:protein crumbs